MAIGKPADDLVAVDREQWPDDVPIAGPHAAESAEARAADEVEEDGLDVVVAVMSHGDGLSPQLAAERLEPFVAQGTGGHLRGDAVLVGIVGRVEIDATEG